MNTTPLDNLLDKLCSGDVDAAEQVFRTYEPYLRLVVRRMLPAPMRRKIDSVDVVHSIWADLLEGFRDAGWRFQDVAHLRAFLVKATRNRFLDHVRRNRVAVAAEQPVHASALRARLAGETPRPSELAQAQELWERMLALCPEKHKTLLQLKRQGFSLAEIAARTGYHPSSVRRIFYDLSRQLAAQNAAEDPRAG
jgi:RNA polymerase sigma-70 factor (ECF subfamily)